MSLKQIWVAADLHLGHAKVLDFRTQFGFKTMAEHDMAIIQNFNALVKPKDTLILLGDVAFNEEALRMIKCINGIKRLVQGNHDVRPILEYAAVFHSVTPHYQRYDALLTHIPIHPQQLETRFRINIHGHLHDDKIPDERYRCVSLEHTDMRPVLLSSVMY